MKSAILVIFAIFAAGVLGADVPQDRQSSLHIPAPDWGGVWHLLYWGVPQKQSLYPKDMDCLISYATYTNNSYVECFDVAILSDGSQEEDSFDVRVDSLSDGKYAYAFVTPGTPEIPVKVLAHDKYKYTAGIMYYDDKKYLYVYGRNPEVLNDCDNKSKFEEWVAQTDNAKTKPSYVIKPEQCKCADVKISKNKE